MEFEIDDEDGTTVLQSEEKPHTIMNLIRDTLWDVGAEAGYEKGHPYVGKARLAINADDPATAITDAASEAREQLESFRDSIAR